MPQQEQALGTFISALLLERVFERWGLAYLEYLAVPEQADAYDGTALGVSVTWRFTGV